MCILLFQFAAEILEVNFHDLGVGVALNKAEVDLALCVQSNNHGDPGGDCLLGHRVRGPRRHPFSPSKVCLTQQRFIDVDHTLACQQQLKEFEGELLSHHKIARTVCCHGDRNDLFVPHFEPLPHNQADLLLFGLDAMLILKLLFDLGCRVDDQQTLIQFLDLLCYHVPPALGFFFLGNELTQELRCILDCTTQDADDLDADPMLLCHSHLSLFTHEHLMYDGDLLSYC